MTDFIAPFTWTEAIRLSIMRSDIIRAADNSDTSEPDSLGDRLVRCSLEWSTGFRNGVITGELQAKAHHLLEEYNRGKRL